MTSLLRTHYRCIYIYYGCKTSLGDVGPCLLGIHRHYAVVAALVTLETTDLIWLHALELRDFRKRRSAASQCDWAPAISRFPASVNRKTRSRRSFPARTLIQPCSRNRANVRVRVVLSMAKPALRVF